MDYVGESGSSGGLPYPNLIKEYAQRNPAAYFREPIGQESYKSQPDEFDVLVKQHYPAFGSFSPRYNNGFNGRSLTYFRGDRGPIEHGLGRSNEDEYECAKFNILRHPKVGNYNNPDYSGTDGPVTGLNKSYLNLAHYPKIPGTVMSAPLLPRRELSSQPSTGAQDGHFKLPKAQQPSVFSRVFETPELCERLMLAIGHRWGDLSNLSRTCQAVMGAINSVSTRVDLTTGNFLNLNHTNEEIANAAAKCSQEDREKGNVPESVPASFVIVSNVRGRYHRASKGDEDKPKEDKYGYPAYPEDYYYNRLARERVTDTYKLLKSVYTRGSQMKILHLHSMPNLDIGMLRRCLGELPNLEVLGVYNCEMLHFGATIDFLKVIIKHNKRPGFKLLRSDFSPYYYTGPGRHCRAFQGEYGVIPSDPGTLDTRKGIAAILLKAVPLALNNDIDWFTPGTGMRQFLDRVPFALGTVRYILEAVYNIDQYLIGNTWQYYDYKKEDNELSLATYLQLKKRILETLYSDLILAINGTSMETRKLTNMLTRGGDFKMIQCGFCKTLMPCCFFRDDLLFRERDQVQCSGCQLCVLLEHQVDNFYQEKKNALRVVFGKNNEVFKSMEHVFYGLRKATEAEIQDKAFPFWELASTSKEDFYAAEGIDPSNEPADLILNGRPGLNYHQMYRYIYIWKERYLAAIDYAETHIDLGYKRVTLMIDQAHKREEELEILYRSDKMKNAGDYTSNRDQLDAVERYINQLHAHRGDGQMTGPWGSTGWISWDDEINRYRKAVKELTGGDENATIW